jgi:hypothetical protein
MALPLVDCEPKLHHDNHLCSLAMRKQMLSLARLAINAQYICALCGRAAANAENVCSPINLLQIEEEPGRLDR